MVVRLASLANQHIKKSQDPETIFDRLRQYLGFQAAINYFVDISFNVLS